MNTDKRGYRCVALAVRDPMLRGGMRESRESIFYRRRRSAKAKELGPTGMLRDQGTSPTQRNMENKPLYAVVCRCLCGSTASH